MTVPRPSVKSEWICAPEHLASPRGGNRYLADDRDRHVQAEKDFRDPIDRIEQPIAILGYYASNQNFRLVHVRVRCHTNKDASRGTMGHDDPACPCSRSVTCN